MFGLPKAITDKLGGSSGRRKADGPNVAAEAKVLQALHVAAKRSSPHRAAIRADIARAIGMIEAATLGLCHVRELIVEAESLCHTALISSDPAKRAMIGQRYGDLIGEINAIATATGHCGVHLIDASDCSFAVDLGNGGKLALPHFNLTAGSRGLALPKPSRAFGSQQGMEQLRDHLEYVKAHIEKAARNFREHGAELSTHLALVLESAFPATAELDELPHNRRQHVGYV